MSLLWIMLFCVVALVWVHTIADIIRGRYPGWTTAGWIALTLILPIAGSVIYWLARKPTRAEAEQQYLAEAEMRRGGARPLDGPGMGA